MKRTNIFVFLVLVLFAYNSSMADAKISTFGSGYCGYEYNTETREAIVNGVFEINSKPTFTTATVVKIPSTIEIGKVTYTVKSIGAKAFLHCDSLGAVVLPPTIESIGDSAFMCCFNLKSIEIPNSVRKLGVASFLSCQSLTKLELPDDITFIPKSCLSLCTHMEELHLPSKLEKVGYEGVAYCIRLKKLELPSSLKEIEEFGFTNSRNIKSLRIPNSLKVIPEGCFKNCDSLQVIDIPSSVEKITEYAFVNSLSLKEIHFSEGVKEIGYWAFGIGNNASSYNITHLQKVNIPASVIKMYKPFEALYSSGSNKTFCRVSEINYLGSYSDYQKSKIDIGVGLCVPENQYEIFRDNKVYPYDRIRHFDKEIKSTVAYGTICIPRTGAYVSGINKLYTLASVEGQYVKLQEVETTPIGYRLEAGVPYIYEKKTNATSIGICYLNEEVEAPSMDNDFVGTFKDIYAPKGSYVLQSDGKFHIVDADNKIKVAANHCYLKMLAGNDITTYSIYFGGETTGITNLEQNVEKNNSPIYDLSGRRVSILSNGVYIQNGKKFVVK